MSGQLVVRVDDDSMFLSDNLPYVVRDARLAVVARGTCGSPPLDLDPGLYSVEVVTPSGTLRQEVVQVAAGAAPAEVVVREDARPARPGRAAVAPPRAAAPPPPAMPPPPRAPAFPDLGAPIDLEPMVGAEPPMVGAEPEPAGAEPGEAAVGGPAAGRPVLTGTVACTVEETDDEGWVFAPVLPLAEVPRASFEIDGQAWEISLPLNPVGHEPVLRQCRVRIEPPGSLLPLRVSFGDRRRVSRMLDGMLRDHAVSEGAELLDTAAELLMYKYSDPASAALGGLTLHRFGRLGERRDWVENLARDFAWLPDAGILCAALLSRATEPDEQRRGLGLLLAAATRRPLYTDGLSLALELLRRWPGAERPDERMARLVVLADYAADTQWDAVPLTTRQPA